MPTSTPTSNGHASEQSRDSKPKPGQSRPKVRRYQCYWLNDTTGERTFVSETRDRAQAAELVTDIEPIGALRLVMATTLGQ